MIKRILIILLMFTGLKSYGQEDRSQFIGVNFLQLPTSTINLNYSINYKPFLTPFVDIGYTFNYNYIYDISYYLSTHCDCISEYSIDKQSGGYIKIGGYLNLRQVYDKENFFHLGLFVTNSVIYEKGTYSSLSDSNQENIEHTLYLIGLNTSLGYEFRISNRLKSQIDFQLSFPSDKYMDLYGSESYIPGMGYNGAGEKFYPMLILNLKYKL